MSKSVRANIFFDSSFFGQLFDNRKNHHSTQTSPSSIEEQMIFESILDILMNSNLIFININVFDRMIRNWNQSLFVSLSDDQNIIFIEK